MIVRRLAARRLVRPGSTAEEPVRRRATRFVIVVFAAGVLSGAAAWLAFGPFGDVQGLVQDIFAGGPPQISVQEIYPRPGPTHRVVDVYDPPAPGTYRPAPQPTRVASTPPAERSSEPGDDGPGDN